MTNTSASNKVLVLLGSPRKKGNSNTLAEQIIRGAESAGATVEKISLHGKNISPFNSGCVNALRTFQDAFRYVGAKIVGMVYGSAEKPGEIKLNKALMQQAELLGKTLAST